MKMKRILTTAIALMLVLISLASCQNTKKDISGAKTLADLEGAKIAAQQGTFHADAAAQIKNVKLTQYPEFADMLTALKSGAVDGYIAEEPTARAVCSADTSLAYLPFINNDTGFTATDADVGIAVGLKTGSELRGKINAILAEITEETRIQLMLQTVQLTAGESVTSFALASETPAQTNGVLKVGMECAYEPYNWTDLGTPSFGAVPITSGDGTSLYANGFDVQVAKYIADNLGMKLEIYQYSWDALIPAVQSGALDAIIAGMSPTAAREEQIDFTDVYYSSTLVVIYKKP